MRNQSLSIAGTAVLGALVIIFDLALWSLRIKIPFPLFPRLRFDISGIPVILSLFLYGPLSGAATSIVLFLIVSFRDPFSAFMKALAEMSTVAGMIPFYGRRSRASAVLSVASGVTLRVGVMVVANTVLLPAFSILSWDAAVSLAPFMAGFNVVAGIISSVGAYAIYQALLKRFRTSPKDMASLVIRANSTNSH